MPYIKLTSEEGHPIFISATQPPAAIRGRANRKEGSRLVVEGVILIVLESPEDVMRMLSDARLNAGGSGGH